MVVSNGTNRKSRFPVCRILVLPGQDGGVFGSLFRFPFRDGGFSSSLLSIRLLLTSFLDVVFGLFDGRLLGFLGLLELCLLGFLLFGLCLHLLLLSLTVLLNTNPVAK